MASGIVDTSISEVSKKRTSDGSHELGHSKRARKGSSTSRSTSSSSQVSGGSSSSIKPEFIILEGHSPTGPNSLESIAGVQQLSPKDETMWSSVEFWPPRGRETCYPPNQKLLAKVENGSSYKKVKKLFETFLGDLKWQNNSWTSTIDGDPTWSDDIDEWSEMGLQMRLAYQMSLPNGKGRNTLYYILHLCMKVVKLDLIVPPAAKKICAENMGGSACSDPSTLRYMDIMDDDIIVGEVENTLKCLRDHFENANAGRMGSRQTNPDVTVYYCANTTKPMLKYLFVGEVKSIAETSKSTSCPMQTWIQALAGLRMLDVTYGILFEIDKIMLYQLSKKQAKATMYKNKISKLSTNVCSWFVKGAYDSSKADMFDVEELLDFMKTVICIVANYDFKKLEGY